MFKEKFFGIESDMIKLLDIKKENLESLFLKETNIIEGIKGLEEEGFFELGPEFDPESKYTKIEGTDNIAEENSIMEINNEIISEVDISEYKENLKIETAWSDEIIDSISSIEEGEIYLNSGLKEENINGRACLVKENIDLNRPVDPLNRTNMQRMEKGLSPIGENGEKIELHHIGQKSDGPLVELTQSEHRGKDSDGILHDKSKVSEIDRSKFNYEKRDHWNTRAEEV